MRQHIIPFLKRNVYIDVYGFDGYAEKFKDICVVNHMGELYLKNGTVDDIHCPYFRLRGSPVTEEQAAFIIGRGHNWCTPDGTIGLDGTLGEYPTVADIMLGLASVLKAFPFVDMVIAITALDLGQIKHDVDDRNFRENIRVGYLLHDGTIEILEPEEAFDKIRLFESRMQKLDRTNLPFYSYTVPLVSSSIPQL